MDGLDLDEAVRVAAARIHESHAPGTDADAACVLDARRAIEAAVPLVARQVGECIAAAIEAERDRKCQGCGNHLIHPDLNRRVLSVAADIARRVVAQPDTNPATDDDGFHAAVADAYGSLDAVPDSDDLDCDCWHPYHRGGPHPGALGVPSSRDADG